MTTFHYQQGGVSERYGGRGDGGDGAIEREGGDRKSTRLNSSHL